MTTRFGALRLASVMALVPALLAPTIRASSAAEPTSGTVTSTHPAEWDFAPIGGPAGSSATFSLKVHLPLDPGRLYSPNVRTGTNHAAVLTVTLHWQGGTPADDVYLSATDAGGASVGNDTVTKTTVDYTNVLVIQDPLGGTYTITATPSNQYTAAPIASHAVADLRVVDLAALPTPPPSRTARFSNYHLPLDLMPPLTEERVITNGRDFGEPSIGVDPKTDAVLYQAGLYTMRGSFDDRTRPVSVKWTNVSDAPLTTTFSEDAILDVDRATGRTFVSQLILACSLSAISDDDGASWTPALKACQTPPAVDHQTIGAGPFAAPVPRAAYPDAAYYCSQNLFYSACALSLDGGLTYGASSPLYSDAQCTGLHGHIKVAPDGTAYVPNGTCSGPQCTIHALEHCHPGFVVSRDNGLTWSLHTIDDGYTRYFGSGDPSVGIGARGTMYFGYGDQGGTPRIAVCTDHGSHCGPSVDVGAAYHIANTEMPTVVAGDDNRAAFAFLGSTTPGDDQQSNTTVTDGSGKVVNVVRPWYSFVGTWHLYVAVTYDGGKHWTTTDATPDAPVQRGCIEFTGSCPSTRGSNDQRNLLDFNDLTIDREGRIVAAYTDGCAPDLGPPKGHGHCSDDPTRLSGLAPEIEGPAVARQTCGRGLYARFDGVLPAC